MRPHPLRAEAGFTVVENLVAAVVLVVGLLGLVALLDGANARSASNDARVTATNLARELVETTRSMDYDDLANATLVGGLQARGMGEDSPWRIERRGVDFALTAWVCAFDSPADRIASSPPAEPCSPAVAGTTGDSNGDDFRRVRFRVQWQRGGSTRAIEQTTLVVNPSGGLGPRLDLTPLTQPPITGSAINSVRLTATTKNAAAVHWSADDGHTEGNATLSPGTTPQSWSIDWSLGSTGSGTEVLDGPYQLTAQAFDDRGIGGDAKVASVVLNRRVPYAPKSFAGGHDTRLGDWVDLDWQLNDERDIEGYRVFRAGNDGVPGGGDDQQVCPPAGQAKLDDSVTSCVDPDPPAGSATYYAVALDLDSGGALRQGDARLLTVPAPTTRPSAPQGLTISIRDGAPLLRWQAPVSGSVAFYRIYRGGTGLADRVDRVPAADPSWSDEPRSTTQRYWVTAVDSRRNESDPVGPVELTP